MYCTFFLDLQEEETGFKKIFIFAAHKPIKQPISKKIYCLKKNLNFFQIGFDPQAPSKGKLLTRRKK